MQLMQVAPSGGQICNYASGAILLLDLIQVTESISGSVVPLAMFNKMFDLILFFVAESDG